MYKYNIVFKTVLTENVIYLKHILSSGSYYLRVLYNQEYTHYLESIVYNILYSWSFSFVMTVNKFYCLLLPIYVDNLFLEFKYITDTNLIWV